MFGARSRVAVPLIYPTLGSQYMLARAALVAVFHIHTILRQIVARLAVGLFRGSAENAWYVTKRSAESHFQVRYSPLQVRLCG